MLRGKEREICKERQRKREGQRERKKEMKRERERERGELESGKKWKEIRKE